MGRAAAIVAGLLTNGAGAGLKETRADDGCASTAWHKAEAEAAGECADVCARVKSACECRGGKQVEKGARRRERVEDRAPRRRRRAERIC